MMCRGHRMRIALCLVSGVTTFFMGSGAAHAAYADGDKVYRGGQCGAGNFTAGTGVTTDASGKLLNVSVFVAPGQTDAVATATVKNGKIGVSTIGKIKAAGGTVVASPNATSQYHATLSGITAATAESLFATALIPNPNKC
jgi:hypothetical protein